jgi:hypothetical protein
VTVVGGFPLRFRRRVAPQGRTGRRTRGERGPKRRLRTERLLALPRERSVDLLRRREGVTRFSRASYEWGIILFEWHFKRVADYTSGWDFDSA